ncbi:MAG TPA: hypothetical protein VE377_25620 [Candidatus Dormibacteraeota bacterium]|nr:hypothetical protein [Candidatus Dormibacteraeota bacterium]
MSTFQTVTPSTQQLDPSKRVNYTFGLVLGVDDFLQEQTYFLEKDHSQYRLVHGYGTVCGLRVRIADGVTPEVRVSPGVAINPEGQEIHVEQEMCARINDWLTGNKEVLQAVFGTPPVSLPLCVVLCYRECPSDMVPVPGEPCRTQQDAMAASRITESFQLKLCLDIAQLPTSPPLGSPAIDPSLLSGLCYPPSQIEENAIRALGQLLRRIEITDSATVFLTGDELNYLVRQLATTAGAPLSSPPQSSPPMTSPPWDNPTLFLHPSDAADILRAAFLVWITEVRPALASLSGATDCGSGEQCVLLAELSVPVSVIWNVSGTIDVNETHRPYLLPSRLLQEILLSGLSGGGAAAAGDGSFRVAAGTFNIVAGQAIASGPVFNGLVAKTNGNPPGIYLLQWTGSPAYVMPGTGSPAHNYVVTGTPVNANPPTSPLIFEIVQFVGNGILIRVCDVTGAATAKGFTVEIKELTATI